MCNTVIFRPKNKTQTPPWLVKLSYWRHFPQKHPKTITGVKIARNTKVGRFGCLQSIVYLWIRHHMLLYRITWKCWKKLLFTELISLIFHLINAHGPGQSANKSHLISTLLSVCSPSGWGRDREVNSWPDLCEQASFCSWCKWRTRLWHQNQPTGFATCSSEQWCSSTGECNLQHYWSPTSYNLFCTGYRVKTEINYPAPPWLYLKKNVSQTMKLSLKHIHSCDAGYQCTASFHSELCNCREISTCYWLRGELAEISQIFMSTIEGRGGLTKAGAWNITPPLQTP